MQIKVNSNRSFIIKLTIPFIVVASLYVIGVSITISFEYDEEFVWMLIFGCVFLAIMVIVLLFAKFYKGKNYVFTENEIVCYKRKKQLNTIEVSEIEKIEFYPYKWRYIITIFLGELPSGGCWSLHISMKNGTKKVIRFFSKKDAEMLKEKIFGDLLTII